MEGRTVRTPKKRKAFLDSLRKTGNVSKAARVIGAGRQTVYDWRKEDKDFAGDWDDAIEEGLDALEEEARRRAFKGTLKPVFHLGKKCGSIRQFSDTLMIFLLKGGRPEKYRDRHEITGANGGPLEVSVSGALDKFYGDGSADD